MDESVGLRIRRFQVRILAGAFPSKRLHQEENMKILCKCCHGTAEISGRHEFAALPNCKNNAMIERGGGNSIRIRAKNYDLIRIWDEKMGKFVPLKAA